MMGFPFCSLIHLTGMGECDFINDLFFAASMYYKHYIPCYTKFWHKYYGVDPTVSAS